jgi:hypothetical protein
MKNIFAFVLFILLANLSFGQVDLKNGLLAYYPFSGNAKDESGNNNHPVFNNATLTADHLGNSKSAYHFNGGGSYIKIPNSPSLNTSRTISLCAWVRPMGFYNGKCHGNSILMKGDRDYLRGNYFLRFDDGVYSAGNNCYGPMDRAHQNFYGGGINVSAQPYIKPGQWYSVVATYDGKTARLYIDCKLVASNAQMGATFTNIYDLYLGRLNDGAFPYWFYGDLDEVRIYNRALNKEEILALCDNKPEIKKPEYVKAKPKEKEIKNVQKPKKDPVKPQTAEQTSPLININEPVEPDPGFIKLFYGETEKEIVLEKRNNDLVKEIIVEHDSISVTLYDNGIVDGDSVTLIYNDKVLTTHQLLTDKPLTFYIKIAPGSSRNELQMYAENLGSIPPNTALMVIYDGNKRHEVNIKSTENTNGAVSFKLRE